MGLVKVDVRRVDVDDRQKERRKPLAVREVVASLDNLKPIGRE